MFKAMPGGFSPGVFYTADFLQDEAKVALQGRQRSVAEIRLQRLSDSY
jgi:hypothetical protein